MTVTSLVVTNKKAGKRVEVVDIARQYFDPIPEDVIDALIAKGDVLYSAGGFTVEDPLLAPYLGTREGTEDSSTSPSLRALEPYSPFRLRDSRRTRLRPGIPHICTSTDHSPCSAYSMSPFTFVQTLGFHARSYGITRGAPPRTAKQSCCTFIAFATVF